MIVTVFDSESNGFLDVADRLWCIATYDKEIMWSEFPSTGMLFRPHKIQEGFAKLEKADVLVGHNIKKHDLPLFKKLYDWEPKSHQVIVDTLTFSRMLNPKRPPPPEYKGKAPHSIEAWGYRLGLHKPDHTDWMNWSEAMGVRCMEDAKINLLVLEELEREAAMLPSYYEQLKPSGCTEVRAESTGHMSGDGD